MALCYHLPQLNNLLVDQSWRSSINTISVWNTDERIVFYLSQYHLVAKFVLKSLILLPVSHLMGHVPF